jgi:hypothetical protein
MIIYNYCITNSRGETRPSPNFELALTRVDRLSAQGEKSLRLDVLLVLPQLAKLAYGF